MHSVERIYLRQRSSDGSVNKTILKPRHALVALIRGIFLDIKFRVAAQLAGSLGKAAMFRSLYDIRERAIRFRHPDYDLDRAQQLIMSRYLSTCNISSKSMHAFLSSLIFLIDRQTDRLTDKRTRANAFTSSCIGSNY